MNALIKAVVLCSFFECLISSLAFAGSNDCPRNVALLASASIAFQSKWPADRIFVNEKLGSLFLEEIRLEPFKFPQLHHHGTSHDGIYSLRSDDDLRLLKFMAKGRPWSEEIFQPMYGGMLIAQVAGGPRIYQAGRVEFSDGHSGLFVEMEYIFSDRESATLHGLLENRDHSLRNPILNFKMEIADSIAQLILKAFEHRIVFGNDPDFVVSEGAVRWIDTGDWVSYKNKKIDQEFVLGLAVLFSRLSSIDKKIPVWILNKLNHGLVNLKSLDEAEKIFLTSSLPTYLETCFE